MKKIKYIVFDNDGTLIDSTSFEKDLFPQMKDLLFELKEMGVKLYVWTARGRSSTQELLTQAGVIKCFDDMCCGEEAPPKPDISGITEMLMGADSQEVAIIGDSIGDMIGGKSFGAVTIGALWGHANNDAQAVYAEYGAKQCFDSVWECGEYLKDLIRGE